MNADPRAWPQPFEADVGVGSGETGRCPPPRSVLDQRFDVDGLYQVRAAVAAHAAELGLSAELANDVVIAVHELASNAVRHGAGHGRLRIWTDQQALICEVADGAVAELETAPPDGVSADGTELPWPTESGHGLWLAGKVANHLSVRHGDDGTTVTIRFVLGP